MNKAVEKISLFWTLMMGVTSWIIIIAGVILTHNLITK